MADPSSTSGLVVRWQISQFRSLVVSGLASLAAAIVLAACPLPASAGGVGSGLRRASSVLPVMRSADGPDLRASSIFTGVYFFPIVFASGTLACTPTGETYGTAAIIGSPTSIPAEYHPDLNLSIRGYTPVSQTLQLVDYGGKVDKITPPQLPGLFSDNRTGTFISTFQVYDWLWPPLCNCRGNPIADWPVTIAGLATKSGELIHIPASGYDIGRHPDGFEGLVLYASTSQLTFTYTRNDGVALGYALHLEDVCVDPNLLALYRQMNSAGRMRLPALYAGQSIGRAIGGELRVAIRDTGSFMDPRSRGDWWQGR